MMRSARWYTYTESGQPLVIWLEVRRTLKPVFMKHLETYCVHPVCLRSGASEPASLSTPHDWPFARSYASENDAHEAINQLMLDGFELSDRKIDWIFDSLTMRNFCDGYTCVITPMQGGRNG